MKKYISIILKIINIVMMVFAICCYAYPTVYNFLNPELTKMQIFKEKWMFYIYGLVLYVIVKILEERKRAMRKDKCLFCNSKNCTIKITSEDGTYNEIACEKHKEQLKKHASKIMIDRIKDNMEHGANQEGTFLFMHKVSTKRGDSI